MEIRDYTDFNFKELMSLYENAGWTNYTEHPEMLKTAYQNSLLTLGAFDGDKLVGVIRAVGDAASIVYIQDILVLDEYQRRGIGTSLIRALIRRYENVYQIGLMTDNTEKTVSFYKAAGFIKADDMGCTAFLKIR